MFAVVQSGGKQYSVAEGDVVRLESLTAEPGDTVALDVMMVSGDEVKVGAPLVEGASVKAEILGHGRGKKPLHLQVQGEVELSPQNRSSSELHGSSHYRNCWLEFSFRRVKWHTRRV